ncbi:hypothetical protein [Shewanella surugensis]|uniref:Uncharacterized protein n=1 Tax=Shewanella surugensis TaxID=212020 RepID=A0ABT0LC71_9GAMM|nr:hypothetical protein [Shewanella surugensis]MCL1124960.1 hypothetical protein [Shewanella surugensis]
MNITAKSVLVIYLGVFIIAILVAVGVNIAAAMISFSSESIRINLTDFGHSMTDILEVSFGALIGTLSASLQRVMILIHGLQ